MITNTDILNFAVDHVIFNESKLTSLEIYQILDNAWVDYRKRRYEPPFLETFPFIAGKDTHKISFHSEYEDFNFELAFLHIRKLINGVKGWATQEK